MNPRIVIALLGGLAAGLILGRMAPQADLREARAEAEKLRRQPPVRSVGGHVALAGVENMLNVRPDDMAEVRRARQRTRPAVPAAGPAATNAAAPGRALKPQAGHSRGMSNQIEQVKQAWQLRREIARNNFVERTRLDAAHTAALDTVIEAMNIRLGAAIDRWAAAITKTDEFTSETGIRMMNELSQVLVTTYDEMDRKLPTGWRDRAGQRFELVQFVDPEVLTPLQDLGPVLERQGRAADGPDGEGPQP